MGLLFAWFCGLSFDLLCLEAVRVGAHVAPRPLQVFLLFPLTQCCKTFQKHLTSLKSLLVTEQKLTFCAVKWICFPLRAEYAMLT